MRTALIIALLAQTLPGETPRWIGSGACEPCHRAIFESWAKTGMARTSGATGDLHQKDFRHEFRDGRGVWTYEVSSRAGELAVRAYKANGMTAGTKLSYFVGSGSVARSYLTETGGFLYEAPVAFYVRRGEWGLAPGYERYASPYFARAVAPGCLECHATGVQPVAGTQNGYASPPFLEGGAGCERCHGAGSVHARTGRREDIVNPARLDAERRDSVCEQCHLSGEVRVPRGDMAEFTAGQKFADYAVAFSRESSPARMTVTSHVENLAMSACRRASGEKLWCGSCHDAHRQPAEAEKAAWYRSKCLTCHAESACPEKPARRAAQADNCIACHMPRRRVSDAAHVVFTDHSIPRRPRNEDAGGGTVNRDAPLAAFGERSPGARDLGLAYAILGAREQNATYRERAFGLLESANRSHPDDPQAIAYLADLYRQRGEDGKAIPLYRELMRIDPGQSGAPAALGAYAMERGEIAEAIRLWRRALEISPALPLVRVDLAMALIRRGERDEAREVLGKALRFTPEFPAARQLLDQLR